MLWQMLILELYIEPHPVLEHTLELTKGVLGVISFDILFWFLSWGFERDSSSSGEAISNPTATGAQGVCVLRSRMHSAKRLHDAPTRYA
jgi:hypothetical protein